MKCRKGFPGSRFWRAAKRGRSPSPKFTTGFTLIELLVVISIISLLASVIFANVNSARLRARDARRIAEVSQLNRALTLYFNSNNYVYPALPSSCGAATWALSSQTTCWAEVANSLNPYLPVFPVDPLNSTINGNAYVYAYQPVKGVSGYRLGANLEGVSPSGKGDGCWAVGAPPDGYPPAFYCMGDNWQ